MIRKIVLQLIDLISNTSVMKYLNFYERSQYWSHEKLEKLQKKKIRKIIRHSYKNVPYYRRLFDDNSIRPNDIRRPEDLHKIPVLKHEDVRKHLDDLISISQSKNSLLRVQTSGTTGHPLILYKDKNEISSGTAALYRGWKWCGYQIGEKMAQIWGAPIVSNAYVRTKESFVRFLKREIFISAWNLQDSKTYLRAIKILDKKKPKFLRGYASTIYRLARFVDQNEIDLEFDLTGISTTAVPLLSFERDTIENTFDCEVFDQYGSGEVHSIGFECDRHMGLHIPMERVHVEFLDADNDSPVSDGEQGRIVVTSLENYGMPIIRYDTDDLGIKKEESCSCGRGLPLMSSIEGRKNDQIRLPGGVVMSWGVLVTLLLEMDWITKYSINQFQIVQKKEDYIIFKIKSQKQISPEDLRTYKDIVKSRIGDVEIGFEFVDDIPVSASGKRRFVISEVAPRSL